MRNLLIFFVFMGIFPPGALAQGKLNDWLGWFPSHTEWNVETKYNPYLENGTHPHPAQWAHNRWQPPDWLQQRDAPLDLVTGYYYANIIMDQQVEDGVHVVTVGPNFYRLGGQDKRRVMASMDDIYGVTARGGVMMMRDWNTRLPIGAYTKDGLMIQ